MTTTVINSTKYVTAVYRGTEYCLSRLGEGWYISTRRLALGRWNTGGGKHYATLAAVAAGCKAFGSESDLIRAYYGLDVAQAISA
jgi:hypothetical protein